jgi:hypothetical protein
VAVRTFSNVVGFDDAPFSRTHRGDVTVVGAVFAGTRFDGLLTGKVRRDGANATDRITRLVAASRFREHARLILLQGIAVAGFNVIDIGTLHRRLGMPVLVAARRRPDLGAIRSALLTTVSGGRRKWRIIEKTGPMEPVAGIFVQRAGLGLYEAEAVISRLALHGALPEPLRVAHIIAGGLATGHSRGRA